jgi:putative ABC transport system substrate-binding protein
MHRRSFVAATLAFLAAPAVVEAQPAAKVGRLGYLTSNEPAAVVAGRSTSQPHLNRAFLEGLEEIGYVEGQNLTVERRFAGGKIERLSDLAADLVRLPVDAIVVLGPAALAATKRATPIIPIVAIDFESDPVEDGFVASFARPGRNITGLFLDQADLSGKWLELLKEVLPGLAQVAALWDSATPPHQLKATEMGARALAMKLQRLEIRGVSDFESAFAAAANKGAQAVVILSSPVMSRHGARLADLATARRLPTISLFRENATAGCLMAYGPNQADLFHRLGALAGKILKGARPGDIPVERPTRFDLVINIRTAKLLGLTIPQSLLLRADEIIQ